eukprot:1152885-Pelagomonas_calceolata.AAC.3
MSEARGKALTSPERNISVELHEPNRRLRAVLPLCRASHSWDATCQELSDQRLLELYLGGIGRLFGCADMAGEAWGESAKQGMCCICLPCVSIDILGSPIFVGWTHVFKGLPALNFDLAWSSPEDDILLVPDASRTRRTCNWTPLFTFSIKKILLTMHQHISACSVADIGKVTMLAAGVHLQDWLQAYIVPLCGQPEAALHSLSG